MSDNDRLEVASPKKTDPSGVHTRDGASAAAYAPAACGEVRASTSLGKDGGDDARQAVESPATSRDPRPPRPSRGKAKDRSREVETGLPSIAMDGEDADPNRHDPERRCILTGERAPKDRLIRLALGPDGSVAPDVRARAPGRGAWIGVDRPALETAIAKGKLKGALHRAFKAAAVAIPEDLPDRIEAALRRDALDRLGLEARSGTLLTGSDKINDAARRGAIGLLIHAADASADGNRKLDQALRMGADAEGSDLRGLVIPADRTILSMALGRENVVHVAVTTPAATSRVLHALGRWRGFIGREWAPEPCDDASQGPSARND